MNMREFLTAVWPDEGPYCIATPYTIPGTETVTYAHHVTETINDAVKFARGKRETTNLFFAIHTLRHAKVWNPAKKNRKTGETGAYEVRTHANMKAARAFFFDLDVGRTTDQTTKYATREDALSDLARFLFLTGLPDPLVTSSGGGFHVYWRIADALDSLTWKVTAARLHGLARHFGCATIPCARRTSRACCGSPARTTSRQILDVPLRFCTREWRQQMQRSSSELRYWLLGTTSLTTLRSPVQHLLDRIQAWSSPTTRE